VVSRETGEMWPIDTWSLAHHILSHVSDFLVSSPVPNKRITRGKPKIQNTWPQKRKVSPLLATHHMEHYIAHKLKIMQEVNISWKLG
jgi:hypothetical protein